MEEFRNIITNLLVIALIIALAQCIMEFTFKPSPKLNNHIIGWTIWAGILLFTKVLLYLISKIH